MKKTIAIVAGALVLVGGLAIAGGSYSKDPNRIKEMVGWKLDDALDEIDATDAQRNKAQSLKNGLVDEGLKLRAVKDASTVVLMGELKKDRPDANTVHA